jgi:undecaprenyl-diphosphatase
MDNLKAVVLAVIEGITEFLPVSSTGHMAITSAFLDIEGDPFTKLFEVVIQLGAILSVVVLYWKKFINFKKFSFYLKLLVAIIPALAFGAAFKKHIDNMLENPLFISIVLLGGGVVLLFVDRWFKDGVLNEEEEISYKKGFFIGLYQVLAVLLPGLSRSAATIVGGMQQKLTRSLAAEFSFFLAVPTMFAATAKSLLDIEYRRRPLSFVGKYCCLCRSHVGDSFLHPIFTTKGIQGIWMVQNCLGYCPDYAYLDG